MNECKKLSIHHKQALIYVFEGWTEWEGSNNLSSITRTERSCSVLLSFKHEINSLKFILQISEL